ncbi:hypothetical protein [Burkholderia gladioli]|uniref:hypothetical protein n=1 Tax=Burkholderia gladioli TaxID=28095 RepID=UPI000F813402|nr:hypothetical protein [Burkholderia gladioli]MBJ9672970.1 hypothetical protein [Burkholderia gladioli]MBU9191053.1 hypothetical protein [Burkholderia gladioli]MDD1788164.1 hypothetical protein [Burkholderia gladioli]MDN7459819.1 hypothetical protein [Burkholderia gladioli]MDN7807399.1 hypothetical protein [Burkholderia gladioli]
MQPCFIVSHVPAWVVNGVTVTVGLALAQLSIGWAAGAIAAQAAMATVVCDVTTTRRVGVVVVASTVAATLFLATHAAWRIADRATDGWYRGCRPDST